MAYTRLQTSNLKELMRSIKLLAVASFVVFAMAGRVSHADDAKLRLGIAYLGAGQRPQALATFKSITPGSVPAQLAVLWRLQK